MGKVFAVSPGRGGTRQTFPLPCANRKSTRQTFGTRQTFSLPCVRTKKHTVKFQRTVKVSFCRVLPNKAHGKKALFAVCLAYYTRQSFGTWRNYEKKQNQTLYFFVLYIYSVLYSVLKFGIFLVTFDIFSHLISLIEILGLNWKCFEQWSIMDRKMIFMLWSAM